MGTNASLPQKIATIITLASIGIGFLFDYLIVEKLPGVGFSVFVYVLIAMFLGISFIHGKRIRADTWFLLALLAFFATMVGVRDNELLAVLNIGACALLLLLATEVHVRSSLFTFDLLDYVRVVFPPFQYIDPMVKSVSTAIAAGISKRGRNTAAIIRGIAITIPIVAIFLTLFASADPTFERFFHMVFGFHFFETEYPARVLIAGVIALVSIGAYSYAMGEKSTVSELFRTPVPKLGRTEIMILLGSVTAVFVAFVLVQASYFFGGADYVSAQGLTYAEYARRGFFELVFVSVLAYLVLAVSEHIIERDTALHSRAFKIVSAILIALTAVIMVSSFYKLVLYEAEYGFTTLRLYSHAFVVLLAFTFASLLYKIVIDIRNDHFAFRTFITIVFFVAAMNILNPDAYIASKNLDRLLETGKIDLEYLVTFSNDATRQLVATQNAMGASTTPLSVSLNVRKTSLSELPPWQAISYADVRTRRVLQDY